LRATEKEKKPTEAAIEAMIAADQNVVICEYQALEKRIALKSAENTVEAQKACGRAIGWLVQLQIRQPIA
jgi:TnpA family transposase